MNLFLEESIAAFRHFTDMYKKFKPEPLLPLPKPPPEYDDETGEELPPKPEPPPPIEVLCSVW